VIHLFTIEYWESLLGDNCRPRPEDDDDDLDCSSSRGCGYVGNAAAFSIISTARSKPEYDSQLAIA